MKFFKLLAISICITANIWALAPDSGFNHKNLKYLNSRDKGTFFESLKFRHDLFKREFKLRLICFKLGIKLQDFKKNLRDKNGEALYKAISLSNYNYQDKQFLIRYVLENHYPQFSVPESFIKIIVSMWKQLDYVIEGHFLSASVNDFSIYTLEALDKIVLDQATRSFLWQCFKRDFAKGIDRSFEELCRNEFTRGAAFFLLDKIRSGNNLNILELGCGEEAFFLKELVKSEGQNIDTITGIDPIIKEEYNKGKVTIKKADLLKYSEKNESIDIIYEFGVLYYLASNESTYDLVINKMIDWLAPGGRIILSYGVELDQLKDIVSSRKNAEIDFHSEHTLSIIKNQSDNDIYYYPAADSFLTVSA